MSISGIDMGRTFDAVNPEGGGGSGGMLLRGCVGAWAANIGARIAGMGSVFGRGLTLLAAS